MLTSRVQSAGIFLLLIVAAVASLEDFGTNTIGGGCVVPFSSKTYFAHQWPLIFHSNGSLYETVVNADGLNEVVVAPGEEVIVSCGPNYIRSMGKLEQSPATCGSDEQLHLRGQAKGLKLKDLRCDLRPIEETMQQVYGCPSDLSSTRFGYVHPLQKHSLIIGESCYDMVAGKTHFAHVKLGDSSGYLQRADKSFLLQNHPDSKYKIEFFKALLFEELYERVRTKLDIKQAPGLSLINYIDDTLLVHPQFKSIKKLSWNYLLVRDNLFTLELLKEDIRDYSKTMELDLYTGSHGVNALKNSNGEQLEIYAEVDGSEGRFPMPELIWILVKNANKAVAFGVFNDPDSQPSDVTRKTICKSECEKITWLTRLANSKYRGPLICCHYNDFEKAVQEVPKWTGINELLL